MNRVYIVSLFLVFSFALFSQEKNLDKLEMYYDQEHYKIVVRKADELLDNPDYDYTVVPKFYKSIALFQLNQNKSYRRRKKNSLKEAISLWEDFVKNDQGSKVFDAHIHEVIDLKQDITLWREELKRKGEDQLVTILGDFLHQNFKDVDNVDEGVQNDIADIPSETDINAGSSSKRRRDLIKFSKTLVGIKYKYGGVDKKGFDCSGFTTYVFKKFDVSLPRRARDQHANSKKKKIKDAKVGDLVFFSSGGGVNHVGIIVSNKNGHPIMIHASTSQGIVETDIMSNSYWKPRLKFAGSYLD
jgi:hypothetical protein